MNVVLWILQALLAAAFLGSGLTKLGTPREKLAKTMGWVDDVPQPGVLAIGAVEILAAVGLILPAALKIAPVLTPLAAVGLIVVMVGAAVTHGRRHETAYIAINVVLLALAAVVAWGRFGPYSISG
jgi:uncharacterized membrane protein YphA (DoxX/SURF4 family)